MSKLKKALLFSAAYVLVAAIAVGGTLAYLTSEDADVNVMTLGNVEIEQIEQQRVNDSDGQHDLEEFVQNKPVYPAVYEGSSIPWAPDSEWVVPGEQAWKVVEDNANVVDKFVSVKNTGKTDAYVRTIIAFEVGEDAVNDPYMHLVCNGDPWELEWITDENNKNVIIEIDGNYYVIGVFTYTEILPAGETTIPNLKQVYLDKTATNDVCEAYGDTFEIFVISQAIQTAGFENAAAALNEGFGDLSTVEGIALAAEWFGGLEWEKPLDPDVTAINTFAELKDAARNGGKYALTSDLYIDDESEFFYGSYVTAVYNDMILDLNGHSITIDVPKNNVSAAPILFYVYSEGASLTIIGDGDVIAKNDAFLVFPRGVSEGVYIYGGNYYNNDASSGTKNDINAIVYSQTNNNIHIYGGTFTFKNVAGHCGGFNVYDNSGAEIVLHEGVLLSDSNYYKGSDANEIHLAEGCSLQEVEIDGVTWYKVVKQ